MWLLPELDSFRKKIKDFISVIIRYGIMQLSLESINRPGETVTFSKLGTFQVDKARKLSRFVNVIGVQSLNY